MEKSPDSVAVVKDCEENDCWHTLSCACSGLSYLRVSLQIPGPPDIPSAPQRLQQDVALPVPEMHMQVVTFPMSSVWLPNEMAPAGRGGLPV
jgi:hypothetical protein